MKSHDVPRGNIDLGEAHSSDDADMSNETVHEPHFGEPVQGEKDINATLIGVIGFLGALIVFIIIILLQVIYYAWVSRAEARHRQILPEEVVTVRTEQQLRLQAQASQVGSEAGVLPIDKAMELVLRDLANGRPAGEIGGKLAPPPKETQGVLARPPGSSSQETQPKN